MRADACLPDGWRGRDFGAEVAAYVGSHAAELRDADLLAAIWRGWGKPEACPLR